MDHLYPYDKKNIFFYPECDLAKTNASRFMIVSTFFTCNLTSCFLFFLLVAIARFHDLLLIPVFTPAAIHSVPTSSGDLRPHSSMGLSTRTAPVSYNTSSAASYASAVQIYTQKLSSLRPRSASLSGQKTGTLLICNTDLNFYVWNVNVLS